MPTIKFTRTFAAAHRVWNDPGKCRNIHGHNYEVKVTVRIVGALTPQNFVVPFDAVKAEIDRYDHTLILDRDDPLLPGLPLETLAVQIMPGVPSTELLAEQIAVDITMAVMEANPGVTRVRAKVKLRENASIESTAEARWRR